MISVDLYFVENKFNYFKYVIKIIKKVLLKIQLMNC